MKYFIVLFVIYLTGMMVLPCSDAFNECNTAKIQLRSSYDHSHNTDSNDNCSPFCNCNCCHTMVDASFLLQPSTLESPFIISKKYPLIHEGFVSNYYGNIWQPPKV